VQVPNRALSETTGKLRVPVPSARSADLGRANRVFQQLLKRPGFSWQRDGEALRRPKPRFFDRPTLPCVTPVDERLVEYLQTSGR